MTVMLKDAIRPAETEVCPVCGAPVARYPEWTAEAVLADGSEAYFDGPKDLFELLLAPEKYCACASHSGDRGRPVVAARVTSYYDREVLDAEDALYVVGSDVLGPAGSELVPHRCLCDAVDFMIDHGGKRILAFDDVTQEVLAGLARRMPAPSIPPAPRAPTA